MANTLNSSPQIFIDRVKNLSILFESFIYVLRMWRVKTAQKEFINAYKLQLSMVNDIDEMLSIIDNKETI